MILKRGRQSPALIAEKSERAVKLLVKLPEWKAAKTVMLYAATKSEVQTRAAIDAGLAQGKRVCMPSAGSDEKEMDAFEIKEWDDLKPRGRGYLEPVRQKTSMVEPAKIGLIVVPGVAFDQKGNRLGRGAHYYDDFLRRSRAPAVALAFEMQVVKEVPVEAHDVAVCKIVTEKRVIECR